MFWSVIKLLICFYCSLLGAAKIGLNPNSTVFADVVSVLHDINDQTVRITLQSTRSCTHPTFIVRMSGSALYMLELQQSQSDSVFTYKYPCILDAGEYFLEVVALYCTQFNPNNYTGICMENAMNNAHFVTLPYSVHLESDPACEPRARWKLGAADKNGVAYTPELLSTRHQLMPSELPIWQTCITGIIRGYCNPSGRDLAEYNRYVWMNTTDWRPLEAPVLAQAARRKNRVIRICYVGDSHTGNLALAGDRLPGGTHNLRHIFVQCPVPALFKADTLTTYKCSIAIIAFGQWMFGNGKKAIATTGDKYSSEIRSLVHRVGLSKTSGRTKVFFRTENFDGLGARYFACPPLDYRSIPAIRMVNSALRNLSQELNFNLIDLTHIQTPMWDGAPDFNHPPHNVFDAQLEWILQYVFNNILDSNATLVTYTQEDDETKLPKHDPVAYRKELLLALHTLG